MSTFLKSGFNTLVLTLMFAFPTLANAVDAPFPSSGTASIGSGVSNPTDGNFGGNSTISWSVTYNGSSYDYVYHITSNPTNYPGNGSPTVTETLFWLQTGPNVSSGDINISGTYSYAGPSLFTDSNFAGAGVPGDLFGVVLAYNTKTVTATINTPIAPVWGNFAVTGYFDDNSGSNSFASFNSNYLAAPPANASNYTGWIPTPGDAVVSTPEPATLLMLGSLLTGVAFLKRKRV